jgi:U6 snRNA-associated Sm-like protein LSm6
MPERKNPSDFLSSSIGSFVIVRLYSGIDYHGKLTCLDGYLNIALENCSEVTDNKTTTENMGDTFIRGNNGIFRNFNSSFVYFKSILKN